MARWLEWLETGPGQGAHSIFIWVGILTLAFLAVVALARLIRAATGVAIFDFGSRGKGRGTRSAAPALPGGHEKILVVDDERIVRESTTRCLAELGYQVVSVDSGEAAVQYMESNGADLVLLDLRLAPNIDGVETFRRISALRPLQKAIVMTGFAGPAEISAVRALGIAHYLIKPTPIGLLARAIREELDRP